MRSWSKVRCLKLCGQLLFQFDNKWQILSNNVKVIDIDCNVSTIVIQIERAIIEGLDKPQLLHLFFGGIKPETSCLL